MKKNGAFFLIAVFLFMTVFHAGADTVFEEELRSAVEDSSIVFQNYTGPHSRIDSIQQIIGIGTMLGSPVGRESGDFDYYGKYRVIHAVDYTVEEGLDADIFILSEAAGVDHIVNLRRILAGFLSAAYGYDGERAALLSEFITVYNAVYRGDMEYFSGAYKPVVTRHLVEDKAGLALSYKEWAGGTMIMIPLTPKAGTETTADLDTDVISDDAVVEKLREEDGKGIEQRRELVELKEDEVLEEREEIAAEREDLAERREELAERREDLEASDEAGAQEEIAAVEEELRTVDEAEKQLDEREEAVEAREERIVAEREAIAEDQAGELEKEERPVAKAEEPETEAGSSGAGVKKGETIAFLLISGSEGNYSGRLVIVDPSTGTVKRRSELDSIRLRGYRRTDAGIVSVAGEGGGNRIVSLVIIDPDSLEVTASGTDEVYIDSAVVPGSGGYYAVVRRDGDWKLGFFDGDLALERVSDAAVFPATEIYLSGKDAIVQDRAGNIRAIGEDDFRSAF